MTNNSFCDYFDFPYGLPIAGRLSDQDSLGYVYVIGFEEPEIVKIGVATSMITRLNDLQVGNPFELKVHAVVSIYSGCPFKVEKATHRLLADQRIRGEWFQVEAAQAVEAIIMAARNLKASFGSVAKAHRDEQERHRESMTQHEINRRAALRRKLGMDEEQAA